MRHVPPSPPLSADKCSQCCHGSTTGGGAGLNEGFRLRLLFVVADSLPGAWVIHPVLIMGAKLLIDSIPGMQADISWTIVNIGYMVVSRTA